MTLTLVTTTRVGQNWVRQNMAAGMKVRRASMTLTPLQ